MVRVGMRRYGKTDPGDVEAGGPTDARELEAFFDGLITAQLRAYQVPGATLSVVKDGEILLAKGYGFANLEEGIPVRANQTLFPIASVTKLFTSTAVMQLAEQGKLKLGLLEIVVCPRLC